jgi:transcriptional regulator with XRE-family HTH domain
MARAALKLGVRDVATAAQVSPNTVTRLEAGLPVNSSTVAAIRAALEAAGVEFIAENGGGAGVRLRQPEKELKLREQIANLRRRLDIAKVRVDKDTQADLVDILGRDFGKSDTTTDLAVILAKLVECAALLATRYPDLKSDFPEIVQTGSPA